jgi:putative pyruvate formate lyase activating enzyme
VVKRNHLLAYQHGEVIVRHLVLPNHGACCSQRIIDWIKENIPQVAVNIMGQYRPEYHAEEYKEIAYPVSKEAYLQIKEYAKAQGLFLL